MFNRVTPLITAEMSGDKIRDELIICHIDVKKLARPIKITKKVYIMSTK